MTLNRVCWTKIGVFPTRAAADRAVAELRAAGYSDDQIGLVGKDGTGQSSNGERREEILVEEGAAVGATVGAATGAAIGAGIVAGIVPVIGPVLALGTLGTVLVNAAGIAAAGGLAGALVGWGISEGDASYYEGQVSAGRFLVTVADDGRADAGSVFRRLSGDYPEDNAG